jgi:hypothetical protein
MESTVQTAVCWYVSPCSMLGGYHNSCGKSCLHGQGFTIQTARCSKSSPHCSTFRKTENFVNFSFNMRSSTVFDTYVTHLFMYLHISTYISRRKQLLGAAFLRIWWETLLGHKIATMFLQELFTKPYSEPDYYNIALKPLVVLCSHPSLNLPSAPLPFVLRMEVFYEHFACPSLKLF